jgi:hypothetical protein
LKQQALFFDQIGIYNLDWIFNNLRNGPLYQKDLTWFRKLELDLEWLRDNDVVIDLRDIKGQLDNDDFIENIKLREQNAGEAWELINQQIKGENVGFDKLLNNMIRGDAIAIRELVVGNRESKDISVIPTLQLKNYLYEIPNSRKVDVIDLVINKFPIPNQETPWENICDYRNNPESKKYLLNLRRWISKMSATTLSTLEIEDEFEGLINDYQAHMNLHKMKTDTVSFQALITLPLGLIENLLNLRISKLTEPFFVLRKRKLSLLEAELTAPGKELTYIIKTQDEFADSL